MNKRLKELRTELGLTLEEFGKKVGVTRSAVGRIEKGERSVTEQMFLSICREFNVNEDWLRNGTGEMFVELTRDEQIADFVGRILSTEKDSFKKRFISMLAALDESDWETIQKMAELLLQEKKG